MADEREETDFQAIELSDAQGATIDTATAAVTVAMGDELAAESVAATLVRDIEQATVVAAAASGEPLTEAEAETAIDGAVSSVLTGLAALSEGIATIDLPAFTYERPAKAADGTVTTEPREIPAGTYELCTIKTLTGERRRRAMGVLGEMGIYTMRYGSGAMDYIANAVAFLTSDNECALLGYLYRRTDGLTLDTLDMLAVGEKISDGFNTENLVGVVNRFFSSSAFGQADGFPGFLSQLARQGKTWLNALTSGK